MIVLLLSGGLGNQMFAYAYAKSIAEKTGEKLVISNYGFLKDKQRSFSLHHFKAKEEFKVLGAFRQAALYLLRKIRYRRLLRKHPEYKGAHGLTPFFYLAENGIYATPDFYTYYPYVKSKKKISFVDMGWQSYRYFEDVAEKVRNSFTVTSPVSTDTQRLAQEIRACNAVCVHIRRGDYCSAENKKIYGICDEEYYAEAMHRMRKLFPTCEFFVFSNSPEDIGWIKENYSLPFAVHYVDLKNPDFEDLYLMTQCSHFIISNSSFSWWASYLCSYEEKKIFAPNRWINGQDDKDIFCPDWEVIECQGSLQ